MPAVTLYGRRWHFSTDIMAVPALLSALFHTAWIIILLVWAAATAAWPGRCASSDGVQYVVLFGGMLAVFGINLVVDVLLAYQSLQGGPFEASKRRWVVPLLYCSTLPLVCTLGLTVYGTHVVTHLHPDCWRPDKRNAVTNLAQGLVFSTWAFMSVAALGILTTYNMYPQHHDLSSWEARCECIAAMLCCHSNVMRRPDGKRPPLSNIAELTAGLLSHVDLDATDLTAALMLTSAAQNRRRRLRVAKALLPVYKALRSTAGSSSRGGSAADEQSASGTSEREEDDDSEDASSTTSSVNDVPTDRELDRMIAAQQAQQARQQAERAQQAPQQQEAGGMPAEPAAEEFSFQQHQQHQHQQHYAPQRPAKAGRRGLTVSWAQDRLELVAAAAVTAGPPPGVPDAQMLAPAKLTFAAGGRPDLSGISLPPPAQRQAERQQAAATPGAAGHQAAAGSGNGHAPGASEAQRAASLPLTEDNVALLDRQLAAMEAGGSAEADQLQTAAERVAGELLNELPDDLPDQHADIIDQLAGAIEEEIRQLGGEQLPEEAILQIAKEDSLDVSALQVNPESPSIWFSTTASQQAVAAAAAEVSSVGSRPGEAGEAAGGEEQQQGASGGKPPSAAAAVAAVAAAGQEAAAAEEQLASQSPFYTAGGGSHHAASTLDSSSSSGVPEAVQHAAVVEAAAATAMAGAPMASDSVILGSAFANAAAAPADADAAGTLPPADMVPPADDAAASAVAAVAAAAAAAAAADGSPRSPQKAGSEAGTSVTSGSRLDLSRQLTLKYPVVITPSEHVDEFRGPLSPDALADIYAGRHDKVPSCVLREAIHFLKYSYAVYSLQPKIEAPSSGLDLLCNCCKQPPNPQKVVFKGLSELEQLDDDSSVELLHLNCSNRVLAHLPYMIALDHGKKAVVLAIRGTISAADIVTDAIVYPEPLDSWLPDDIREELGEPAFAHAGMVAAAKAIFEDMTERGILQQLVQEEAVGDYTAPEEQQAQRGSMAGPPRHSQYDADSRAGGTEQYNLSSGTAATGHGGAPRRDSTSGASEANRQSTQRGDAAGRLWEGTSAGAARSDKGAAPVARASTNGDQQHDLEQGQEEAAEAAQQQQPPAGFSHHSVQQQHKAGKAAEQPGAAAAGKEGQSGLQQAAGAAKLSPGRQVGGIMRAKIQDEGWQLIVQGHSLGAGAAALVSLKLRETYPGLKCIAYSCPGALVSKNLSHAMRTFCTTVVVGKDAVPRSNVGNLTRLMDEMVTALARCKQPKLKVLFYPWWRRRKAHFKSLFYDYDQIPPEPLAVLQRYYESRARIGQPLSMYPPGRLLFLRPIKTRQYKEWDAVWLQPEDIIAEGILLSPHMLRDHLCSTAFEALTASAERAENGGIAGPSAEVDARSSSGSPGPVTLQRVTQQERRRRQMQERLRQQAARRKWRSRFQAQTAGSLQQVLIEAS